MNNKGISLVTVVVIIIVMIIIASVSIIAGNKLIVETKELANFQTIETIREAINRLYEDHINSGMITPKGEGLIGRYSPAIGNGDIQAVGWYLLDEDALTELGINQKGKFLINYKYSAVLDMSDSSYVEEYNVIEFMYNQRKLMENAIKDGTTNSFEYAGEELNNDTRVYVHKSETQTDVYGLGWYYVEPSDMTEEYKTNVKGNYLINYDDAKYVRVDSAFERIRVERWF